MGAASFVSLFFYLSFALPMFRASKSINLYKLERNVPSFGVGVTAAIAEKRAITAVITEI